ncbi:MAG: glycoside hydrolase family 2 TIM barrel-domain containing protein [Bacilli bacterium]|nr:glycoside hydrolase family 2 TIM barrel-domain containing protein [Bacilli bacterium]MDD4056218.1 glycoside hydrolase family 2 TIM barrel-domain containing protein [Bacilli bacterium]
MREMINLNFNWFFSCNFEDEHLKDYTNVTGFHKVHIPHNIVNIPFNYFDEKETQKTVTYKHDLEIKEAYQDKSILLIFEGVAHVATIYINDDFVLTHKGGYDEFSVDISEYVKYGEKNILTVIVDSRENPNVPPFGGLIDYLGYGGIYREVYLEIADKDRIVDVFVKTKDVNSGITAFCDITVNKTPVIVEVEVQEKGKQVSLNRYNINREKTMVDFDVKERKIWDLDHPNLYDIIVRMYDENVLLDEVRDRFGFREIAFDRNGLNLNGKNIKLRGLNRHQSYPYVGYAMPKSAQEKDADILKYELGVNIVRTSHYMQSKHFLNRCDEIGLLVLEEIPGWQHIGNEEFKHNCVINVERMITRDKNHPSIVLWGVRINESFDDDELYKLTNETAHKLDDTRPTGGIRNFLGSKFLEDVFTFNDFTHNGGKKVLAKPRKTPHLITENNGHMFPTKRYDSDSHRLEHALRHYRVLNAAAKSDNIVGSIGWCFTDYNTHKDFGSGDNVCYHGVMDMFRIPKYAAYSFASQKEKPFILEVLSTFARGDYPASKMDRVYIATNCEYIKMFRNDDYVGTFYPNNKEFASLVHPVVIIDDFIGVQLEKRFGFTKKSSTMAKKAFKKVAAAQGKISPFNLIRMLILMIKYKLKRPQIVAIFYEYAMGKFNLNQYYRFDGYVNENVVISQTLSEIKKTSFTLELDKKELIVDKTYDVTRLVIKMVDQNDILVPYGVASCNISVSGGIDLIGPNNLPLLGGAAGFWVKTNQTSHVGKVDIEINGITLTEELKIIERIVK